MGPAKKLRFPGFFQVIKVKPREWVCVGRGWGGGSVGHRKRLREEGTRENSNLGENAL